MNISDKKGKTPLALEGVRILDFSWFLAGPIATKYFADNGATVVRIESAKRPDNLRTAGPYKDRKPGINRGGYFAFYNSNKYGMALNMKKPEAVDIARRLAAWADIVIENFVPGTIAEWGLGYQDLIKIKPDLIMLSTSIHGQTGPNAPHLGFGGHLVGFGGFVNVTGWPDRPPVQPFGAYTDLVVPSFGAALLLAALDYRERTGKGQYIDLSQYEAGLFFLGPQIMDYMINGKETPRMGNACPYAAPHGIFRSRGDDRWCAIAIFKDSEWSSFTDIVSDGWTGDDRFSTLSGRKENEDELNKLVETWTIRYSPKEVMELLQSKGIGAGAVSTTQDAFEDPQLNFRDHYWKLEHGEMGTYSHFGQSFKLSETEPCQRSASPCLGEHTELICREILKMTDEEFVSLLGKGVFE